MKKKDIEEHEALIARKKELDEIVNTCRNKRRSVLEISKA
jgi:hypothetical protein